jgi:hypothetical protein
MKYNYWCGRRTRSVPKGKIPCSKNISPRIKAKERNKKEAIQDSE